jgi:hypothetical protein
MSDSTSRYTHTHTYGTVWVTLALYSGGTPIESQTGMLVILTDFNAPLPPEAPRERTGSNSNVYLGGSRLYARSEYQLTCFGNCPQYKRKDITLTH